MLRVAGIAARQPTRVPLLGSLKGWSNPEGGLKSICVTRAMRGSSLAGLLSFGQLAPCSGTVVAVGFARPAGQAIAESMKAALIAEDKALIRQLQSGLAANALLSDLRMPGKTDGRGFATWLRDSRPGVLVIILVGNEHQRRSHRAQLGDSYGAGKSI